MVIRSRSPRLILDGFAVASCVAAAGVIGLAALFWFADVEGVLWPYALLSFTAIATGAIGERRSRRSQKRLSLAASMTGFTVGAVAFGLLCLVVLGSLVLSD